MRWVAWWRRRPVAAAAALYALVATAFFFQAFLPGRTLSSTDYLWTAAPWLGSQPEGVRGFGANPEMADQSSQFVPFLRYARERLPDVPLWNPHVMGGRPFLANAQSAVFSPFSLPAYVLPFWRSLGVIAWLKVFAACFGTFLLARALAIGWAGAMLAGLAFGLGLFFVVWLAWPLSTVWAWLPWVLLLTDRVARRPGPLPVAGLAAVTAGQYLGGHPESSFHVMFAALAFLVLRLVRSRRERSPWRPALLWAGGVVLGTALAGVAVVPFLELLGRSGDVLAREEQDPATVQTRFIVGLVLPEYYGRPTAAPFEGALVQRAFYFGALPLMLAAAALVIRPSAERIAVACFGLVVLAVVFGVEPVFSLVRLLPGFDVAHNTRLTVVFLLCAALLAGWGLDDLLGRPPPRRAALGLGIAAALLVVPVLYVVGAGRGPLRFLVEALGVAWGFETPPGGDDGRAITILGSLVVWVTFAGAGLALLALRRRGALGAAAFAGLALLVSAGDLFRAGMGLNPAIPIDHATQPVTGALERLRSDAPARFAGATPEKHVPPVVPNAAMTYDLYDARGYDYPIERRYDRLWRRTVQPVEPFRVHTIGMPVTPSSLRTLRLLGVRQIMQRPADRPLREDGLRLAYDGEDARLYELEDSLPRAWVAGSQTVVGSDDEALEAVSSATFDPRASAVTERRVPGVPEGAGGPAGEARIVRYEPERVELAVEAGRAGVAVLSDLHYPGWKAELDGREVDIERVDYLLRGVPVTAGRHRLELRYEPLSWRIGWILSLVALFGTAALAAWGVRRA